MQLRGRRDANKNVHLYNLLNGISSSLTYHLENDAKLGIMDGGRSLSGHNNKFIAKSLSSMHFDESMRALDNDSIISVLPSRIRFAPPELSMEWSGESSWRWERKRDKLHKMELIAISDIVDECNLMFDRKWEFFSVFCCFTSLNSPCFACKPDIPNEIKLNCSSFHGKVSRAMAAIIFEIDLRNCYGV